jgi:uncharacterized protein (TIGR04255 family)
MGEPAEFRLDLAEAFPHLPAAPVVEAVIHWTAKLNKPLVPEAFRRQLEQRLGGDYPKILVQKELRMFAQVDAEGTSTQQRSGWRGFRLESADGRYIAQFNNDGLVFSRLAPYETWERFSAEGRRLWNVFCELGAISEVQRLGVRYINRFPLSRPSDAARFLQRPPQCLEHLGLPSSGFLFVSKHDVPHQPFQIEVTQTVQPPTPPATDGFGLILDIDVFTTRGFQCDGDELDKFLATMRWLKNKTFFALISDEAVELSTGQKV